MTETCLLGLLGLLALVVGAFFEVADLRRRVRRLEAEELEGSCRLS
jgi:hypothetical protein